MFSFWETINQIVKTKGWEDEVRLSENTHFSEEVKYTYVYVFKNHACN